MLRVRARLPSGSRLRRVTMVRDFPLFPLGLVALPSELVPLHIFEERFKTMMARCLEEESEFGIVWMADDGLRPVGCACEIAEVLERMPDGRLNLVVRGTRPFRIEARQRELAYPAGPAMSAGVWPSSVLEDGSAPCSSSRRVSSASSLWAAVCSGV